MMLEEKKLAKSMDNYRTPLKEQVLVEIYKYAKYRNNIAIKKINRAGTMGESGVAMYLAGTRKYLLKGIVDHKRYGSYMYEVIDKCRAKCLQQLTPKDDEKWSPKQLWSTARQKPTKQTTEQPSQPTPKPLKPDQYCLLIDNEPIKLYNSIIECKAYGQALIDTNKDKEINMQIKGIKFFNIEEV